MDNNRNPSLDVSSKKLQYHRISPKIAGVLPRRRVTQFVVVAGLGMAAFALGYVSRSDRPHQSSEPIRAKIANLQSNATLLQHQDERFASVVAAWKKCVVQRKGDLPDDPYIAIADLGIPTGFKELRFCDFQLFVPPRINVEFSLNRRWLVFMLDRKDLGEQWLCYADGTWMRASAINPVPGSSCSVMFGDDFTALKSAGYPVQWWHTLAGRAAWMAKNRGRLVWDGARRTYVVRGDLMPAATQDIGG